MVSIYATFFTFTNTIAKHMMTANDVRPAEVIFMRSSINLVIAAVVAKFMGHQFTVKTVREGWLVGSRSVALFGVTMASTWVIQYLPLSIAFVIAQLNPFFVAIISFLLLGESLSPKLVFLIAVAYAAVFVIAFSNPNDQDSEV